MSTHPINEKGWQDAYFAPQDRSAQPLRQITAEELGELLTQENEKLKRDGYDPKRSPGVVVVDVRRADCESMIPSAINLPAHSLPVASRSLVRLLHHVPLVVFHCNSCSGPKSRGPMAAGWYADALAEEVLQGSEKSAVHERVAILTGGMKRWLEVYGARDVSERGKLIKDLPRERDDGSLDLRALQL